jgi:hypothetical protein
MILTEALLRYADWLFARALELREAGDIDGAEALEKRASEYLKHDEFRSIHSLVIASEAKQSSAAAPCWIASSLRSSQ